LAMLGDINFCDGEDHVDRHSRGLKS